MGLISPWAIGGSLGLSVKKKNLRADNINNYRPVTNVPLLSKLVERVVVNQLQALPEETNALQLFTKPIWVQAVSWHGDSIGCAAR